MGEAAKAAGMCSGGEDETGRGDCAERVSRGNSNCAVPRMLAHVFKLPSRDRTGSEEL